MLGLALVSLVLRAWSVDRWTWTDDDWTFMHLAGTWSLRDYLLQNHQGHVEPAGMLVTLVMTRLWPLDRAPVVVLTALLCALVVMVWGAALREVFGERLRLLAPLAVIALTPLAVRPTMWWAAALHLVPLQVAMGAGVWAAARYARKPSAGGVATLVAVLVAGLLCEEKSLLVVPVMLATVLFCSPEGLRGTVRRTWPLLLAFVVMLVPYVLAYHHITTTSGNQPLLSPGGRYRTPGLGESVRFYGEALTNTLTPGVLGGPWGATPTLDDQLASTALWIRVLTTVALVAVAGAGLLVRRRAWIPVTMAFGYSVLAVALVLFSNRYLLFGEITIHDERYTYDVIVVWVFALTMLVTPLRDEPPDQAFRRRLPPRWSAAAPKVAVTLAVALVASLAVANVQVISRNGTQPGRAWVQHLLADVHRLAPADLYDARLPLAYLPPPGRYGSLSRMLSPLGSDVRFNGPAETLLVPDKTGRLRPAVVSRSITALPGPDGSCGYAVRSEAPVKLALDGKLFAYPWAMELTAYSGKPSVLQVLVDGQALQVPVNGFGRQQIGFEGAVDDVTVALLPGSQPVCLTDVAFGSVTPGR